MKRVLFAVMLLINVVTFADCINCPKGTTAPGAAASPTTRFNGYTSEVNKYDGTTQNCYTPTANTLNGHLKGINNELCTLQDLIDSLSAVIDYNDSVAVAGLDSLQEQMDTVYVRLDSIVTALGQFYNTSIISSDSSLNVSSSIVGEVITFNLSVDNDSIEVTTSNALSGNGKAYNPIKLGGTLTENTTITGDKSLNLNIQQGYFSNKYDTIQNNLLLAEYTSKYNQSSDFVNDDIGIRLTSIRDVRNGTWNLSSYEVKPTSNILSTDMKMTSSAILLKTGDTSAISFGDVANTELVFDGQSTTGGHITSMRNLTLSPIFKGGNSLPFTVYRYVSLAISDLTQTYGDTAQWIIPTERYAIYQEGETDKVWLNSAIIVAPNLPVYANDAAAVADTAFPSGGLYLTTGSVALKVKP